ncbi:putative two-component system response regulator [Pseudoduganella lurida]|uniref:Putative two-component system response regulator n=1 Tax=Pseudoduganella lurida TaxID=1036180 RepID=A0A562R5S2_9BURK|nr:HD domain-containing phosphohydrolase [Pseudoduganella lurida]TWI64415.1 putative two-component system response regulator [Pseudoduganella lurida]
MKGQHQTTVLICDGAAERRHRTSAMLREQHDIDEAADGAALLRLARGLPRPDVIVLDAAVAEPFALVRQLKADPDTAGIPLLLAFDAVEAPALEARALAAGVADVLVYPFAAETLRARVARELRLREAQALLRHEVHLVDHLVAERTRTATQMADAVIWALATLAERRDSESPNHLHRIQHYVATLARHLQTQPRFAHELTDAHIELLFQAAPLHDIGKAAIPDAILQKPGRLTAEEFETVKLHTVYGRDAIDSVAQAAGSDSTFLRFAREITYSHHERFDGSGYPQGLAGDAIPVAARLLAVADVYDALISRRVYKPAFTHETAVELIRQGSGEHFDPDIVDAMLATEADFLAITQRFHDPH